MRTFVKLRDILKDNTALRKKLEKHDEQIKYIFNLLAKMLPEPEKPKNKFGFHSKKPKQKKTKTRTY